jgi:hypothetical protein
VQNGPGTKNEDGDTAQEYVGCTTDVRAIDVGGMYGRKGTYRIKCMHLRQKANGMTYKIHQKTRLQNKISKYNNLIGKGKKTGGETRRQVTEQESIRQLERANIKRMKTVDLSNLAEL